MKIAIVGTGKVARGNYIPYLAEQEDVELLYANRTVDRAVECAEEFGGTAFPTLEALLDLDPDAVLVLTSETARYEVATAILNHGTRRLFFEKPLVAADGQAHVSEDDFTRGAEILQRATEAGTETAMVFNYRFFEQSRRARALVAERSLGAVQQINGLVNYCTWSHVIDLMHGFAGPVRSLTALQGETVRKGADNEAVDVSLSFVTEGGAVGALVGTAGSGTPCPLYELTVAFDGGRLTLRGLDGDLDLYTNAGGLHETMALTRHTSRWDQYAASFRASLAAYLESIRAGTPPPVPGRAGLMELQFEAAFRRAIRTGKPVDVATEFPLPA